MRAMITTAVLGIALAAAAPSFAQAAPLDVPSGAYVVDPSHASIVWRVKHLGLSYYTSRFTKFDARVQLDAAQPTRSSVTVSIDPKSVRTDFPFPERVDFDKELGTGDKWLNGNKFPAITFKSTSLAATGPRTGRMTGDLTLLGVTRPVTLDVTLVGTAKAGGMMKADSIGFQARGAIKRSDFGWTTYAPMIGDEVEIQIDAEFNAAPAAK